MMEQQRKHFEVILEPLRSRLNELEVKERRNESRLRVAIDYINDLHSWIDDHLPGAEPPDLPPSLKDDA